MENERKFTYREHLLGACQAFEVGTAWEDRYTKTDAFNGACTDQQVGQLRGTVETETVETEQSANDSNLEQLPREFVYERELADYHRDRDAYRARSGSNLGLLLRIGEERKREMAASLQTLDDLTAKQLAALPDLDWMKALVATLQRVENILAQQGASIDVRAIFREEIGLTPEAVQELQEAP